MKHPTPWRVDWTNFGESMGYDRQSRIVDANGETVLTVRTGGRDVREMIVTDELIAHRIVSAVNRDIHTKGTEE